MSFGPVSAGISNILSAFRGGGGETIVKIISLPAGLQNVAQPTHLKGEVRDSAPDGTTRIQTDQGEMVVQYPPRRAPATGQRVDVDLPPGTPPQKAALRPTPDARAPAPPPQQAPTSAPAAKPIPDRVQITPAPPQTKPESLQQSGAPPPPNDPTLDTVRAALRAASAQTLDVGTIARLSPVALAKLQAIIVSAALQAQNIKTDDQSFLALIKSLVQAPPSAAPALAQKAPLGTPQAVSPLAVLFADDGALHQPQILPLLQNAFAPFLPEAIAPDALPATLKLILTKLATLSSAQLTTPGFEDGLDVQILQIGARGAPTSIGFPVDAPESGQATAPLPQTLTNIRVLALTAEGFPIIRAQTAPTAPPDFFILQGAAPALAPDVDLALQPLPTAAQSFIHAPTSLAPLRSFDWSALDQILRNMMGFDAATALATTSTARPVLPIPNLSNPSHMGPAALFFLAALRSGDLNSWLGDKTLDALKRGGKQDLLTRLTETMTRARAASSEPVGEWRVQPLPIQYDGQVYPLSVFYRQQQDEQHDKDAPAKKQTRFIIDLALSRMGPVQVDGLVRDKKLDTVIRTETALSADMQTQMQNLYARALAQVDYTGDLGFQSRPDSFVKIADLPAQSGFGLNA